MLPKPSSNGARGVPSLLEAGRAAVGRALAAFAVSDAVHNIVAVDATCGNGNDTLFLAQRLRELTATGQKPYAVLGLDVQSAALAAASALLGGAGCGEGVRLVLAGHEGLASLLGEHAETEKKAGRPVPVTAAVMYNLGFLPRSDRQVTTRKESTLASLEAAAGSLAPGGIMTVHAYGGHEGGADELAAVSAWCEALPYSGWRVARYAMANKPRNPETLFLVEKLRGCNE